MHRTYYTRVSSLYRRSTLESDRVLELLKAILFAPIRFHDTANRGRLLNRFGKDFEGIDSSLPDNFGRRYDITSFWSVICC
jgi:hypothetical protein